MQTQARVRNSGAEMLLVGWTEWLEPAACSIIALDQIRYPYSD